MKKYLVLALCLLMVTIGYAQNYTEYFADKTLRVDYIFTGDASRQNVVWMNCPYFHHGRKASSFG